MAFVTTHRFSGSRMQRAGRRLTDRLHRGWILTPQERADMYVSRMPIAVVGTSLGAHPSDWEVRQ